MKKVLLMVILCSLVAATGCARKKVMTREESLALRKQQIANTTHRYCSTNIEDVLIAANTVFQLADEDYNVQHSEHGMLAERNWFLYLVLAAAMGHDAWYLDARQDGADVVLQARLIRTSSSIAGTPTAGGGAQATTLPPIESSVSYREPYKLLFARIGFLLKQEPRWFTCNETKELVPDARLCGFEALCLLANDDLPEGVTRRVTRKKPAFSMPE